MNIADLKAKLEAVVKEELVAAEHSRVAQNIVAGIGTVVDQVIEAELHRFLTPGGVDATGAPVAAVERDPNLPKMERVEAPERPVAPDALVQDFAGQAPYLAVRPAEPEAVEPVEEEKTETPAEWPAAEPAPVAEDETGKHEAAEAGDTHA